MLTLRTLRNVAVLVGVLVLLALAFAPRASASLYWSTFVAGNETIARANNDGTGLNPSFIGGAAEKCGVAVDGAHVYWANGDGTIGRANRDGTGVNQRFINGLNGPCWLAVDGSHIYWSDLQITADGNVGSIGRANIDGTGVNEAFITGVSFPRGVAVDQAHVYWVDSGNSGSIGRANIDGSGVNHGFVSGLGLLCGVAVDGAHIYWNGEGKASISRSNLDGSGVDPSFIDAGGGGRFLPCGLAIDSAHIYWMGENTGGDPVGDAIGRANIDGSGANPTFITGLIAQDGLAADAGLQAEQPARISVDDVVTTEGNSGQTAFRFNFSLDTPQSAPVSVDFATSDGTASAPGDYAASRGTLTFAPGETVQTVTVQANGDTTVEPNETFNLDLSNPTGNAAIAGAQGVGTIVNDDAPAPAPAPNPPANPPSSGGPPTASPGGATAGPTGGIRRRFGLGRPRLNRRAGTAVLAVTVPGRGKLASSGNGVRAVRARRVAAPGTVQLVVAASGRKQRTLNRIGKVTVKVKVTFTPICGKARSISKNVLLRKL